MRPARVTATKSAMYSTTAMLWVMNKKHTHCGAHRSHGRAGRGGPAHQVTSIYFLACA
jgi:hypothetical protein